MGKQMEKVDKDKIFPLMKTSVSDPEIGAPLSFSNNSFEVEPVEDTKC